MVKSGWRDSCAGPHRCWVRDWPEFASRRFPNPPPARSALSPESQLPVASRQRDGYFRRAPFQGTQRRIQPSRGPVADTCLFPRSHRRSRHRARRRLPGCSRRRRNRSSVCCGPAAGDVGPRGCRRLSGLGNRCRLLVGVQDGSGHPALLVGCEPAPGRIDPAGDYWVDADFHYKAPAAVYTNLYVPGTGSGAGSIFTS